MPSKDRKRKPATDRSKRKPKPGPACQFCGGATKLVGVQPPERYPGLIIETFECVGCGDKTTVVTKAAKPSSREAAPDSDPVKFDF